MRHTSKTIGIARQLHAAGLGPSKVQHELNRLGVAASLTTIMAWLDDDFREKRNMSNPRRDLRRKKIRQRHAVDDAMIYLRAQGLTYAAIAIVIERYHGKRLCAGTVQKRCRDLGVPVNPLKVALAYETLPNLRHGGVSA
jgi:hypothetical protein